MEKIKSILKKLMTREVILYIVFGVCTTIVNIVATYILNEFVKLDGAIASAIGIVLSILFAFFSNRKLVFNSEAKGFKENLKEFGKFMIGRAGTMVLEEGGVILFNTVLNWPLMPVKITLTVIVIILNFFISKFFAFKKKDKSDTE